MTKLLFSLLIVQISVSALKHGEALLLTPGDSFVVRALL